MTSQTLQHPELIALFQWWQHQGGSEGVVSAADLTPGMLRRWLDNLVVVNTPFDGTTRYAYYGANLAAAFGTDMVGQTIDQLPENERVVLSDEYAAVKADPGPTSRQYTADFGGSTQTWERLLLPFFDAEGAVEKILVAVYRLD